MTYNENVEQWTDERIREAFIYDGGESEYYDPINGAQTQRKVAGDIFDRWLAEHDRQVAERAWDRCVGEMPIDPDWKNFYSDQNPYTKGGSK